MGYMELFEKSFECALTSFLLLELDWKVDVSTFVRNETCNAKFEVYR